MHNNSHHPSKIVILMIMIVMINLCLVCRVWVSKVSFITWRQMVWSQEVVTVVVFQPIWDDDWGWHQPHHCCYLHLGYVPIFIDLFLSMFFFLAWNHQPWFQLVFCVSQAQIVVGKSKEQQHQRAGVAIPQSHRILQPKCIQRFRMVHWNPQSYCRTAGIGSLGKLIFIGLAKGDIKTGTLELLFPHFSMGETPHALLQIFHDVSFKN